MGGGLAAVMSDRARRWAIPLVLGLLVLDGAIWAGWILLGEDPWDRCVAEPASCAGEHHTFPLHTVYGVEPPDHYLLGEPHVRVRVRTTDLRVWVGEELTVAGTFDAAGDLVESSRKTHPLRPAKRRLGVLGVGALVLLLGLVFTVRRTPAGWRVVPRRARG